MSEQTSEQPRPTFQERQRDAALARIREQDATRYRVEILFGTDRSDGGRLGHLVDLGSDSWVGEIHGGWWTTIRGNTVPAVSWALALNGQRRTSELFANIDEALLAYVELKHNGGNLNCRGWAFAARALGVPTGAES